MAGFAARVCWTGATAILSKEIISDFNILTLAGSVVGWDNQGFPLRLEHGLGDLDPVRELPYTRRLSSCRIKGRTDDSIRPRATTTPTFSLA